MRVLHRSWAREVQGHQGLATEVSLWLKPSACSPADAFAAQEAGVKALAAHVQRALAAALVTAAAAVQPEAAVRSAVERLLHGAVHELSALAGVRYSQNPSYVPKGKCGFLSVHN